MGATGYIFRQLLSNPPLSPFPKGEDLGAAPQDPARVRGRDWAVVECSLGGGSACRPPGAARLGWRRAGQVGTRFMRRAFGTCCPAGARSEVRWLLVVFGRRDSRMTSVMSLLRRSEVPSPLAGRPKSASLFRSWRPSVAGTDAGSAFAPCGATERRFAVSELALRGR